MSALPDEQLRSAPGSGFEARNSNRDAILITDRRNVLVIDDNELIGRSFQMAFMNAPAPPDEFQILLGSSDTQHRFEVDITIAKSGEEGVVLAHAATEAGMPFDVAFVDVQMDPGINGIQTISLLWAQDSTIETVLMSGDLGGCWTTLFEAIGTSDRLLFVKKPLDIYVLRQLVRSLVKKRRLRIASRQHLHALEAIVAERTEALRATNTKLIEEMNLHRSTELELRQSQKLEAVGQLAAGIAHEINTPIQFIGDSVEFLREAFHDLADLLEKYRSAAQASQTERTPVDYDALLASSEDLDLEFYLAEVPASLDRTKGGVERVATIVRGMKGFAHRDSGEAAPADINLAVLNTTIVARNEYKYVAELTTELAEIPAVICYVGELNQVFLNLIVNAAHAIADHRKGDGLGHIWVRTIADESHVTVEIEDTGGGIPESIQHRVFEHFFTTKEVGRGTGQGLSLAHRTIVEKHKGVLRFEVKPGVGTKFIIQLPLRIEFSNDIGVDERSGRDEAETKPSRTVA